MPKIGSPLFILREECAKDLMAVLDKIAEMGYDGVEFLGFFGHKPSIIRYKLNTCGLIAVGNHVAFDDFAGNTHKIIDEHKELGCKYITIGAPPAGSSYAYTIDIFERIGEKMKVSGMKLLYHNHAEELRDKINGKTYLESVFDDTRPDLLYCELDLGWIAIGGADPAYYLGKYKNRCPVVHFKDYMFTSEKGFLFRPTGYGELNTAGLYAQSLACDPLPEWYIMDHDLAYKRSSYSDLKISLEYFRTLTRL
jgi:sugar phosphate isomerase/epimerase